MHEDDLREVVERGVEAGVGKFMVTGSDLESSERGVKLAEEGEEGFGGFSGFLSPPPLLCV